MRVLLSLIAAATVAACGGGGGGSSTNYNSPTNPNPNPQNPPANPPTNSSSVAVEDNQYTPKDVAVAVGTTVTWTWGGGYSAHSVTFDDGSGQPSTMTGTFAKTFNTAGKFNYHCTVHGTAMSGSVTVQ
jgi:plastocyanin